MLDKINPNLGSNLGKALPAANRYFADKGAARPLTTHQASVVAAYTEDVVTVTLSKTAITASVTHTAIVAAVSSETADTAAPPAPSSTDGEAPPSLAAAAAGADAQRAQQALGTITQAKGQAAGKMKAFLRQKLEGYKKQLQILRLLGSDPKEIAKGALKVARGVANAARDYAAFTQDEKKAGLGEDSSSANESEAQASQDVAALKAKADAAPLDSAAGDTPDNAPTTPDERFFYDAFRIMNLAKKTIEQARRVDVQQHGNQNAKDFKKMAQRFGELEEAVTKSYIAMKTGGDLQSVDALIKGSGGTALGPDM